MLRQTVCVVFFIGHMSVEDWRPELGIKVFTLSSWKREEEDDDDCQCEKFLTI